MIVIWDSEGRKIMTRYAIPTSELLSVKEGEKKQNTKNKKAPCSDYTFK